MTKLQSINDGGQKIVIHTDGGARGNPGPAAIGALIVAPNYTHQISQCIGIATNNQAEYRALAQALEYVLAQDFSGAEIDCYLDSELVVRQMLGEYKIKDPQLAQIANKIRKSVVDSGAKVQFKHIPRAQNKEADQLVNKALDSELKKGFTFIEIFISSLIFVFVMVIASAGFAQVVKYRNAVSVNLKVNQVARELNDRIASDVRSADGKTTINYTFSNGGLGFGPWAPSNPITVTKSGAVFVVSNPGVVSRTDYLRTCDELDSGCQNRTTWFTRWENGQQIEQALITAQKLDEESSKIKIYLLWMQKNTTSNRSVEYIELVKNNSISLTFNEIFNNSAKKTLIASEEVSVTAFLSHFADPDRIEYTLRVMSPNYSNARSYERAVIRLHSTATPR